MPLLFPRHQSVNLTNGLKIISNPQKGPFNAVGLLLRKGSSSESDQERGINYILSKVLTKHTAKKSEGQLFRFLEENCATIVPNFSKDFSLLTAGFIPGKLREMLYLLGEIVAEPLVSDADIEECASIAQFELRQTQKLHPESLITDWVHYKAFGQNGLGNVLPIFASNIRNITPAQVYSFLSQQLTTKQVMLAAAGVDERNSGNVLKMHFPLFMPPLP